MNKSHKASILPLKDIVIPVPNEATFHSSFDWGLHGVSGRGELIQPLSGAVATVRHNEGKFGGAVAVEEATTNCVLTDFETQWVSYITGTAAGSTSFRDDPIYGRVMKLTKIDGGPDRYGRRGGLSGMSGSIYTHSVYVRALSATGRITCMYVDASKSGGGLITSATYKNLGDLPYGEWVRISTTKDGSPDTLAGGGNAHIWIDSANGECEFALPQVELKLFASSFISGTRALGILDYNKNSINLNAGTISGWFRLNYLNPNTYNAVVTTSSASGPGPRLLIMRDYTINKLRVWDGDGSTEIIITGTTILQVGIWYHFAYTWFSAGRVLYLNGAIEATNTRTVPLGTPIAFRIGRWRDTNDFLNGLLDELIVLPYAVSEDEVRAWYESQAPFYHPQDYYIVAG